MLALDEEDIPDGDGVDDAVEHGLGEGLKAVPHPLEGLLIPHYGEEEFLFGHVQSTSYSDKLTVPFSRYTCQEKEGKSALPPPFPAGYLSAVIDNREEKSIISSI
jgi:hypothetical protein